MNHTPFRSALMALVALATLALLATPALAQATYPAAPTLQVGTWVNGPQVDPMATDKVTLLELWATWCGPCIQAMPHLAKLHAEHPDQLQIVALSEEPEGVVKPFVKGRPDMPFAVAVDKDGTTTRAFVDQFGFTGIPVSILIRGGEVLWHGHPMELDMVLPAVLEGHWSPDSFHRLDTLKSTARDYKRMMIQGEGSQKKLNSMGEEILKEGQHYPMLLNDVAWALLTDVAQPRRPLGLALRMARAANDAAGGQDHNILDTYALALHLTGDTQGAAKHQREALRLCQSQPGRDCSHFLETLRNYENPSPLQNRR